MNNEEFDLEKFVDMFDTAMCSDNPTVQKCFKNLLLVVAIAHAEDVTDKTDGPLRGLVRRIDELERKLSNLEYLQHNIYKDNVNNPYQPTPYKHTPVWTTTNTGVSYAVPNGGATSITLNGRSTYKIN